MKSANFIAIDSLDNLTESTKPETCRFARQE